MMQGCGQNELLSRSLSQRAVERARKVKINAAFCDEMIVHENFANA
jgi:hypothetical protein